MSAWLAFRTGISQVLRYWQMLLALYIINLFTALVLLMLPAMSLLAPAHRTAIRQAADGIDTWMVIEAAMAPENQMALQGGTGQPELSPEMAQVVLVGLITAVALPLLTWLPGSFISGGVLLVYTEASQSFTWKRFLWGCWHWLGAFLLFSLVQTAVGLVLFSAAALVIVYSLISIGLWTAWVAFPPFAVLLVAWLAVVELAQIFAVTGGTRNLARTSGQAIKFIIRNPLTVGGLYGLALLLMVLLHGFYRLGLMPIIPLTWWLLLLVVQQTFILFRLGAHTIRLAGGTALARPDRQGCAV